MFRPTLFVDLDVKNSTGNLFLSELHPKIVSNRSQNGQKLRRNTDKNFGSA